MDSYARTLVPNLTIVTFNLCGLTAPKIAEIGNFWYKFAQKGYTPLSNFYESWRRESHIRTLIPNFTAHALKIWAYSPINREKSQFLV